MSARLDNLQFLRAVAAILVVLTHAQHEARAIWQAQGVVFDDTSIPGNAGVDIFFTLSGFIMVYMAHQSFGAPGEAGRFLVRRFLRVTPLYWLFTTLFIGAALLIPNLIDHARLDLGHVLSSYAFVPFARADDGLVRPVFALGWTLNYEILFYSLFALGLLLPRRAGLMAVGGALVGLAGAGLLFSPTGAVLATWTHPIVLEFAAGMGLAVLYLRGLRLPAGAVLPVMVLGFVALALSPRLAHDMDPMRVVYYGLPAALILAAAALAPDAIAKQPVARWKVALGDSSYSLYLSHPFTLGLITLAWTAAGLDDIVGPWVYVAVAPLVCVAAGHLTYRVVERPLLAATRPMTARRTLSTAIAKVRARPSVPRPRAPRIAAHPVSSAPR